MFWDNLQVVICFYYASEIVLEGNGQHLQVWKWWPVFFLILSMHIKYIQVYINTFIISWALGIRGLSSLEFHHPFEFKAYESLATSCFVTISRTPKHKYLGKLQTHTNSQTELWDTILENERSYATYYHLEFQSYM